MKEKVDKRLMEFLTLIPQLEEIHFLGIAKILCVKTVQENKLVCDVKDSLHPRAFDEILSDMIDSFCATGKKQRKDILKVMREAVKGE